MITCDDALYIIRDEIFNKKEEIKNCDMARVCFRHSFIYLDFRYLRILTVPFSFQRSEVVTPFSEPSFFTRDIQNNIRVGFIDIDNNDFYSKNIIQLFITYMYFLNVDNGSL